MLNRQAVRRNKTFYQRSEVGLSNDALLNTAPAIFKQNAWEGVSSRYSFIPTITVVDALRTQGWKPVHVASNRVRLVGKTGYQKHMIRFQQVEPIKLRARGQIVFELNLVNSHDRSSVYELHPGIFKATCTNGLITDEGTIEAIRLRHSGLTVNDVIQASAHLASELPKIEQAIVRMQEAYLSPVDLDQFVKAALTLRYGSQENAPQEINLAEARRAEDGGSNVWDAFNRIQENLIQGGSRGYMPAVSGKPTRRATVRAVTSIDQDIRINEGLWAMATALVNGQDPMVTLN